ncbi:hypothetical protein [Lewinella sp. IMCC34191]|uniref:hypothetical protein n=1 Tax=Lewinella sp. IMCC34191 TaxID=2259172 RepID=UPI000E26C6E3|nr:hypothetical protein [Lewinella sp. IMCC34191]
MFNSHSPSNERKQRTERILPEVADRQSQPVCSDSDQLDDVAAFKVFLKRNMRHEAPPADLLGNIRARIREMNPEG